MPLASIDWDKLFELVWAAALAGVVVSGVFATLILGVTRASDLRREGHTVAAAGYTALAVLALLAFAGSVVFGVSVIVAK
jgi:hypothetical protein